jgi:signal transduction histidine kinase
MFNDVVQQLVNYSLSGTSLATRNSKNISSIEILYHAIITASTGPSMETFLQQIFDIITLSPGNLIVHLALAFSVMVTLQAVLAARRSGSPALAGRLLFGLGAILLGQIVLFAASGLAWQGIYDPRIILPPLDRAVITWSLIWIAWLWSVPNKAHAANAVNGLLNLVVVILLLFTFTGWSESNLNQAFNSTWYDWGWGVFSIFIILLGMLFLLMERPEAWGVGLSMLLLNLAGYVAHVLWGDPGSNYAAAVRLAQLASYPLLPSLAHRLNMRPVEAVKSSQNNEADSKRRYTADPRAVHAWLQVAVETEPEKIRMALARAFAQTMLSDLCFLVPKPSPGGQVSFEFGYDLIRDEEIPSKQLKQADISNLAGAILRGRPIRLGDTGQVAPDIQHLADALGLEQPGNLLSIPLASGDQNWGSIILLSPYSKRVWSVGDQNYLLSCMESVLHLLDRRPAPAPEPIKTAPDNSRVQDQVESLKSLVAHLHDENQVLTTRLAQTVEAGRSDKLEALLVVQKESQDVIRQLQQENEHLRAAVDGMVEHREEDHLETEMRDTLKEMARLQNALAGANMKILSLEMQNRTVMPSDTEVQEVIISTIQELRQPITSVIGYTDLLMAETVGLLGTLQRKFLERVRASTERMRSLLEDLIRITVIEGGKLELTSGLVDTAEVIDAAVAATRGQIQEKGISLQLDLPDDLPKLRADQDALEQIMVHLLQNASSVTPPDGVILFRACVEENEEQPYLLLQVTDSGGGIPPEDLPRIFFRNFRAENPLIQGIGDKGIGLSIAKVLVESHGGRIWVDSISGKSATFSVLIPTGHVEQDDHIASYESIT